MCITRAALTVVVLVATAGSSMAAEIRGTLANVDAAMKEIRLQERPLLRRPGMVLTFDADLQIMNGRNPVTLADLAPGQRVRIEYEMREGKTVARTVHLLGGLALRPTPPADGPPGGPGAVVPPDGPGDLVTGSLARVGLSDRELVVMALRDGAKTEVIVAVPETCKITRDGKMVGLEAFNVGDVVTVRVEKREGRLTALAVQNGKGTPGGDTPRSGPAAKGDLIPKIRMGLKFLDFALQQLDSNK